MEKRSIVLSLKSFVLYALVLAYVSGCAVVGMTIPDEKRITLAYNQQVNDSFKDGPLTVEFSYSLSANQMKLTGVADYSSRMDSLDIRLLLLDVTGTVLQQTVVYSSGFRTDEGRKQRLKFDETIALPVGVVGISFGASGQSRRGHR